MEKLDESGLGSLQAAVYTYGDSGPGDRNNRSRLINVVIVMKRWSVMYEM